MNTVLLGYHIDFILSKFCLKYLLFEKLRAKGAVYDSKQKTLKRAVLSRLDGFL